ncbi:MAG: hypothetical protein EHM70_20340 [Chloroflexota bacterium]|nr:MAG: hypothetical protein EHM70_20340 [Chloroflexota bacterium]
MKRKYLVFLFAVLALILVGCTPSVSAINQTSFPVRVVIVSGKLREVLSPSPGESSTAEVGDGAWTATVIPDAGWIEYAKAKRAYLNELIANSQNMTGQELLDTIQALKEIATQMAAFEEAARGTPGASCSGAITDEVGFGEVVISAAPDGTLLASCK